ncbi:MAG TPA: hypothetical protein EYQ50_29790 [Verrucomicrobiales bacterium]|nr:hypothetical protein [Verrucomicrobiales bacterium]
MNDRATFSFSYTQVSFAYWKDELCNGIFHLRVRRWTRKVFMRAPLNYFFGIVKYRRNVEATCRTEGKHQPHRYEKPHRVTNGNRYASSPKRSDYPEQPD